MPGIVLQLQRLTISDIEIIHFRQEKSTLFDIGIQSTKHGRPRDVTKDISTLSPTNLDGAAEVKFKTIYKTSRALLGAYWSCREHAPRYYGRLVSPRLATFVAPGTRRDQPKFYIPGRIDRTWHWNCNRRKQLGSEGACREPGPPSRKPVLPPALRPDDLFRYGFSRFSVNKK